MLVETGAGESPAPADEPQLHAPLEKFHPEPGAEAEQAETEQQRSAVDEVLASPAPPIPPAVDVHDLDWERIAASMSPGALRARMRATVEQLEALLDSESGAHMLFDDQRDGSADRALKLAELSDAPLWFIGDIHGDLLTLGGALALIARESERDDVEPARIVLLGDLFDDGGYGLETLLRVFELILERSRSVCFLAGNHDEALGYNGARFTATVSPSDFADFLNENLAHEWIGRVGKLAVRIVANAPRALFFPDGLLAAHGGFPLTDRHQRLAETRDWNDPQCLSDFVWTRAHPRARKKLPNRTSRGSQFGYEDFAAFCALSARLGRPVTHMVRGHDHVEERYEIYPAYADTPVLTTVALSRRLVREMFGPFVRVPTIARWIRGSLPQVYRLHIPEQYIRGCYPEDIGDDKATELTEQNAT
ncbi:MAG: metallophosphoesterase [Gemmatimonadales bacterium]|nr:metallophosphoesterase [Gemmatimonadales bacterium]MDQ3519783.1 metallophosphoesterase [Gemmatimonadota bacterium]